MLDIYWESVELIPSINHLITHSLNKELRCSYKGAKAKEKGADLDAPILGLTRMKKECLTWFWVKGAGGSAWWLGEGVHGCVVPSLCDGVPDGETLVGTRFVRRLGTGSWVTRVSACPS